VFEAFHSHQQASGRPRGKSGQRWTYVWVWHDLTSIQPLVLPKIVVRRLKKHGSIDTSRPHGGSGTLVPVGRLVHHPRPEATEALGHVPERGLAGGGQHVGQAEQVDLGPRLAVVRPDAEALELLVAVHAHQSPPPPWPSSRAPTSQYMLLIFSWYQGFRDVTRTALDFLAPRDAGSIGSPVASTSGSSFCFCVHEVICSRSSGEFGWAPNTRTWMPTRWPLRAPWSLCKSYM
jgi:hypothetical protein